MNTTSPHRLALLLPAPGNALFCEIRRGSAIVGSRQTGGDGWIVDFEGNVYGAENMTTFEGRLQSAAGRHVQHYPTTARLFTRLDDMLVIGYARRSDALHGWIVETLDAPDRLAAWLDPEPLPRIGGSEDMWERAAGRLLSSGDLSTIADRQASGNWRDAAFRSIARREAGLEPPL